MPQKTDARFLFAPANFDDSTLLVLDFEGREQVSQTYHYTIRLVSEDPDLPLGDVANEAAELILERNEVRYRVPGYVKTFRASQRIDEYYLYEAELVPHLWKLNLSYQHGVFQDLSVPDIIAEVLDRNGFAGTDYEFRLNGSYPARDFCVQYKESDLNFIQRLMEYEGIFYFFEFGSREKLIMTDHMGALPEIEGGLSPVVFNPVSGMVESDEDPESVFEVTLQENAVTGKVRIRDWNYRTEVFPDARSELNDQMPGEYYDYGIHVKDQGRAATIARIRNEEFECGRTTIQGKSDVTGFHAGHSFALEEHFRGSMNREYFLTRQQVWGNQRSRWDIQFDTEEEIRYRNAFAAIPVTVPFRPERTTPEPKLPGIMTANVESTSDDYSHLDDQGRYKIKMPFDLRGNGETQHSKVVRLGQPYTSKQGGYHWHLEKDTEMVLACVDGNPDRIMAIGATPKPSKDSPVNRENFTQHWLKTTKQNEIWMEDLEGKEGIKIWSPTKRSGLQLGYRNHQPIDGFSLWTDGTGYFQADRGLVFKGGSEEFDVAEELNRMNTVFGQIKSEVDSTVSSLNLTRGRGPADYTALTDRTNLGVDGEGGIFNDPGITFIGREGGLLMGTESNYTVVGEDGLRLLSPMNIDMVGLQGIFITSNQGIDLLNEAGGIDIITATDGIAIQAVDSGLIYISTHSGDIKLTCDDGSIETRVSRDVFVQAGENLVTQIGGYQDEHIEGRADIQVDQSFFLTGEEEIVVKSPRSTFVGDLHSGVTKVHGKDRLLLSQNMNAATIELTNNSITLRCGASSISMDPAGQITIQGNSINLDAGLVTTIGGTMGVTIETQGVFQTSASLTTID